MCISASFEFDYFTFYITCCFIALYFTLFSYIIFCSCYIIVFYVIYSYNMRFDCFQTVFLNIFYIATPFSFILVSMFLILFTVFTYIHCIQLNNQSISSIAFHHILSYHHLTCAIPSFVRKKTYHLNPLV